MKNAASVSQPCPYRGNHEGLRLKQSNQLHFHKLKLLGKKICRMPNTEIWQEKKSRTRYSGAVSTRKHHKCNKNIGLDFDWNLRGPSTKVQCFCGRVYCFLENASSSRSQRGKRSMRRLFVMICRPAFFLAGFISLKCEFLLETANIESVYYRYCDKYGLLLYSLVKNGGNFQMVEFFNLGAIYCQQRVISLINNKICNNSNHIEKRQKKILLIQRRKLIHSHRQLILPEKSLEQRIQIQTCLYCIGVMP